MERPLGALIAILVSIWGIFAVATAFEAFVLAGLVFHSDITRRDLVEILVAAVLSSFLAVLFIRIAWGLLNLRKWARTLTILIATIGIAVGLISLVSEVLAANWKYSGSIALSVCLNLAALWYLLMARGRDTFTPAHSALDPKS